MGFLCDPGSRRLKQRGYSVSFLDPLKKSCVHSPKCRTSPGAGWPTLCSPLRFSAACIFVLGHPAMPGRVPQASFACSSSRVESALCGFGAIVCPHCRPGLEGFALVSCCWGARTGREAWLPKTQSCWVQSERPAATKGWICRDHHRKGRGGSVIL